MMRKHHLRHLITFLLLAAFWVPAGTIIAATVEPPKNPNSAKGCAICHYRWIDTFFVEGKGTDLVPYQSEKVAADPEMCFSCHDGSVMDSRERMRHGNEHKTNVKPPAEMIIPEIFPLDEDGKVQCATCHTAHGVESGPGAEDTIFMRTSNRDSAMCRMCHPDKDGGPDAGNHSLTESKQRIPQSLKMRGAHEGSRKNQMICETCHTAHGAPREGYLVIGAGDSGLCVACHADKDIFDPAGVRNANHVINVRPQKAAVPEALLAEGARLGYDNVITCQTCHKIHNNNIRQPALLVEKNEKSRFCMTCHADKQRLEKTRHNLAISAKNEKNLQGKTVAESGICSACHLPHKPARSLHKEYADTDRTTASCMSCHAKGTVAENEKLAGYSHPVGMTLSEMIDTADRDPYRTIVMENERLDLPLFNAFGVADKNGKVTCATCHDTHGGPEIQTAVPRDQKDPALPKNTLLRKPSPELCRACHADKFDIQGSGHDLGNVFPDGNPIIARKVPEPDLCRNCHFVHNREADGFAWSRGLVTEAGTRVFDMCTECHQKDGLAGEKVVQTNSHPVNIKLTDKTRNTRLPLYDASGKVQADGVMTCYTCHDPHRRFPVTSENGEFVLADGRPEDRFLRIDKAPESELCVSCHTGKAAVRQTDHNLVRTASASKNAAGRTPFESGVCGACHQVHNNAEGIRLWAQGLGDGAHVMNRMCNFCHSENGVAADKVPQISSHPETLFVGNLKSVDGPSAAFPVFDPKTGQVIMAGNISCPSCHDAHRWRSDPVDAAGPEGTDGDASTSFLRPHLPERVCRQCHGPEGLFLFKYFHKADKRITRQPGIGGNYRVLP